MYGTESSTMSGSHILIQRLNSQSTGNVTVFLVHVVCPRTGVITKPDTVILHSQRPFLRNLDKRIRIRSIVEGVGCSYLIHGNNFPTCLFDFSSLLQKIPESRFCDLGVGCKDAHSIQFGGSIVFSREFAANDLVLVETRHVCFVCL